MLEGKPTVVDFLQDHVTVFGNGFVRFSRLAFTVGDFASYIVFRI